MLEPALRKGDDEDERRLFLPSPRLPVSLSVPAIKSSEVALELLAAVLVLVLVSPAAPCIRGESDSNSIMSLSLSFSWS